MDPKTQTDGLLVELGPEVSICWVKHMVLLKYVNYILTL